MLLIDQNLRSRSCGCRKNGMLCFFSSMNQNCRLVKQDSAVYILYPNSSGRDLINASPPYGAPQAITKLRRHLLNSYDFP